MNPAIYVTNPDTGKRHLAYPGNLNRTLCGQRDVQWWDQGDETVNGVAAVCRRCRSILKARNAPAVPSRDIDTMRLADMTPEERDLAVKKAAAQLQAELTRNAGKIAAILEEF